MDAEPLVVIVARPDVEAGAIEPTLRVLQSLLESPETIRRWKEKVVVAFHGYDHDHRELHEIEEVRNFVFRVDQDFPFWLFFLSREASSLLAIAYSFLPPFLTPDAQRRIWPERLTRLMERRWFPAMADVAARAGLSDADVEALASSAAHYFMEGPRTPFDTDAV